MKLKLRSVGTSTGVLLPKEMLARMKVKKDDTLFAVETPKDTFSLLTIQNLKIKLLKVGNSWPSIETRFEHWQSERATLD
jgi:hypothetical protein